MSTLYNLNQDDIVYLCSREADQAIYNLIKGFSWIIYNNS